MTTVRLMVTISSTMKASLLAFLSRDSAVDVPLSLPPEFVGSISEKFQKLHGAGHS